MIYTTLNEIRSYRPCKDGWEKLLAHLGKTKADDEPLAMITVLDSNGLRDALWTLRVLGPEHHKLIVSLACDFAERVLKYIPTGETRPAECIKITRLWLEDKATLVEVQTASAAWAAWAASVASATAWATAEAAGAMIFRQAMI